MFWWFSHAAWVMRNESCIFSLLLYLIGSDCFSFACSHLFSKIICTGVFFEFVIVKCWTWLKNLLSGLTWVGTVNVHWNHDIPRRRFPQMFKNRSRTEYLVRKKPHKNICTTVKYPPIICCHRILIQPLNLLVHLFGKNPFTTQRIVDVDGSRPSNPGLALTSTLCHLIRIIPSEWHLGIKLCITESTLNIQEYSYNLDC